MNTSNKNGFTAIEIMIVIAVIATLTVVVLSSKRDLALVQEMHKHNLGELVYSKLDGRKGMVASRTFWNSAQGYKYSVRFGVDQLNTEGHILGSGGPIKETPYALVGMYGFELTSENPESGISND
jgi:prepilin-type N-terminal cleavage/methylation domain-containing protein